jgi:hypothetical protein
VEVNYFRSVHFNAEERPTVRTALILKFQGRNNSSLCVALNKAHNSVAG